MTSRHQALIAAARKQHGEIQPCSTRRSLEDCFTEEEGRLHFWFNIQGGNTRVLVEGRVI